MFIKWDYKPSKEDRDLVIKINSKKLSTSGPVLIILSCVVRVIMSCFKLNNEEEFYSRFSQFKKENK